MPLLHIPSTPSAQVRTGCAAALAMLAAFVPALALSQAPTHPATGVTGQPLMLHERIQQTLRTELGHAPSPALMSGVSSAVRALHAMPGSPGTLDAGFDADGMQTVSFGGNDFGYSLAVDGSGRVLVAGSTNAGGNQNVAIARLTSAGALDTSFDTDGLQTVDFGGSDVGHSIAVDGSGNVLVGGSTNAGGSQDFAVARLTSAGALDTSFDTDGMQTVDIGGYEVGYSLVVDGSGSVLIGGHTNAGGSHDFAVARLTSAGALDTSFDTDGKQTVDVGGYDIAYAIAVDGSGRALLGGYTQTGGVYDFAIARLTSAGMLDTSFDADGMQTVSFGGNEVAYSVAVDGSGRVLATGFTSAGANGSYDVAIARLTSSGALDTDFDTDGMQTVSFGGYDVGRSIAVDGGGNVLVAGFTQSGGGGYDVAVARLTSTGALDTSFDSDGMQTVSFGGSDDSGRSLAVDGSGNVLVGGYTNAGGSYDFAIARLVGTSGGGQPDLELGLTATPVAGLPGATHAATLTLTNRTGQPGQTGAATGATVTVALPSGLAVSSALPDGLTLAGGVYTWTVASLAPGASTTLSFSVTTTTDAGPVTLTAEVATQSVTPDFDSTPGDGTGDDAAETTLTLASYPTLPNRATVMSVSFSPIGTAYAAAYGLGVYAFDGTAWTLFDSNQGLTNLFVWDVQVLPNGDLLAATWGGGLFHHDGTQWAKVPGWQADYVRGITLSGLALYVTGDINPAFATSETGTARVWTFTGVYGESWTFQANAITRTAIEPWEVSVDALHPNALYLATRKGLYASTDGGTTWAKTAFAQNGDTTPGVFSVIASDVDGVSFLYVGTKLGIWRSPASEANSAASWEPVNVAVAGGNTKSVYDLVRHPISGRLYAAYWGRPGVVVSSDETFSEFTDIPLAASPGGDEVKVNSIAVAPDGRLFLSLQQGGVIVVPAATATAVTAAAAPGGLELQGAAPNPVRGTSSLRYSLPESGPVRLTLYDAMGREVARLADGEQSSGWHTVTFDGAGLSAGVYLVRLESRGRSVTKSVSVIR